MASYNRIIMAGNLTRDPEYKQIGTTPLCRFTIASNRQFKNKQTGTMSQEVCFIDVDVWGNQAESCNKYLQKGRPVLVEGRLKLDSWEQDGQPRRKHLIVADRVIFLSSPQQQSENNDTYSESARYSNDNNQESKVKETKDFAGAELDFKDEPPFEDELPF